MFGPVNLEKMPTMPRVNQARLEEEMRNSGGGTRPVAIRLTANYADANDRSQTARIWGKSSSWVKAMQAAGRVHVVPFGVRERVPRAVAIIGLVKGI